MPSEGPNRVLRGGCWRSAPARARVADRDRCAPGNRYVYLGVRLMRVLGILEQLAEVEAIHGMEKDQ